MPDEEKAPLTEGEIHRLRTKAGINRLAGHEGSLLEWEASAEGQAWLEKEDERVEAEEKLTQASEESAQEVQEAADEYRDAMERVRGGETVGGGDAEAGGEVADEEEGGDLESMTKAELLEEAERRGVDANQSNTKQEIIDAINAG